MGNRGIIGRKPAVAGSSDVFSLDTQYSSSVSGTWPVAGIASGKFMIVGDVYAQNSATIFNAYEKSAKDGKYYPTGMLDTAPRGFATNTNIVSSTVSSGGTHVVIASGTAAFTAQYLDIWKKSTTGLSEYQYLTTIDPRDSSGRVMSAAKFDPTGTYLAVGFNFGGSPPAPERLRIWKRTGDTFTELTRPTDPLNGSSTSMVTYSISWNNDGSSLAMGISVSPYVVIYNRSGDTFTKLASPSTLPTSVARSVAWNPAGTSLAVAYAATPWLIVYNRSGDTFTAIAGTPTPTGNTPISRCTMSWSPDGSLLAMPRTGGTYGYIVVLSRSGDTFTSLSVPSVYGPGTNGTSGCLFISSTELVVSDALRVEIWDVNGTTISRPYAYKIGLAITQNNPPLTGTAGYLANPYNATYPGAGGSTSITGDVTEVLPIPGL